MSRLLVAALLSIAVASACASGASYREAERRDDPDGWRAWLLANADSAQAPAARARLAELEFRRARLQHTLSGYKRFLEEHPEAERRIDALALLEGLRFEAAAAADTVPGWREFLREHPEGTLSAQARARLAEAEFRAALRRPDAAALLDFVARYPDCPQVAEAKRVLDDRLFAEARAGGPRALAGYLEKSPTGRHREEARAELAVREALAHALLDDFPAARRAAERILDAGARARALEQVDGLELEGRAATLDPKALARTAAARPGAPASEANRRARALGATGELAALRHLAQRLDPAHFGRPEGELIGVLAAPDPRDRWLAARELGRLGFVRAIDPLLEAAGSARFSQVRRRAFEALRALVALLPADAVELGMRHRLEELRKLAQGPALLARLALLEELLGDERAAAADYARALRLEAGDLYLLERLATVRARQGEHFGAATAARELAVRVEGLVEQRSREEGLSPLLLARTLCGARDDARAARAILDAIPSAVAQDYPEDLALFAGRAASAEQAAVARLADAEARLREKDRDARGCDDDGGLGERLDEGEADRLRAVQESLRRADPRLLPALERAARRDPAPRVREAARAAVAAMRPRREAENDLVGQR